MSLLQLDSRFKRFIVTLSTVKKAAPGCSGQPAVLDQVSGQFSSPDFGDDRLYDADLSCSWLIVTAPNTVGQS